MQNKLSDLGINKTSRSESVITVAKNNNENDTKVNEVMTKFYEKVDSAQGAMFEMEASISKMMEIHGELLGNVDFTSQNSTKKQLTAEMDGFKAKATQVKAVIDWITNAIAEQESTKQFHPTDYQIKKNYKYKLSKDLGNLLTEYSNVQSSYKQKLTKRMERQAAIAGKPLTYDELEEMIESGSMATFVDQVSATEKAKETLMEIEERHNDIIRLEKNLQELHGLFRDMATMVDEQGELINRIEFNVDQAVDYVESGEKKLIQANEYKKKRNKCIIIWSCIGGVLLLIIIISLAASLT